MASKLNDLKNVNSQEISTGRSYTGRVCGGALHGRVVLNLGLSSNPLVFLLKDGSHKKTSWHSGKLMC